MGKKCTKYEKEKRIPQFVQMLSKGAVNSELIQHAASEWGVDESQGRNDLHEARQVVIDDINYDLKIVVAEMVHMMKAVMKEGFRRGQLNSVIGAANTLSRVSKQFQSTQHFPESALDEIESVHHKLPCGETSIWGNQALEGCSNKSMKTIAANLSCYKICDETVGQPLFKMYVNLVVEMD